MLRFTAIFNCVMSVLLGIAYNMQGMTHFTQILIALNLGMWVPTLGYAVLHAVPWRTGAETLCNHVGSLLQTLAALKFSMQRRAYRKWGVIFYIIGAFVFVAEVMDEQAPLYMIAVPPIIGVMLGIVGWLVNHWPPSEHRQIIHYYEVE